VPRREIRFTVAQDERLRAGAKAQGMSIPDFIRFKTLGEPPGRQRHLARRERAIRERRSAGGETSALDGDARGSTLPPSENGTATSPPAELPTAVQLSNRMRMTVTQAQRYLDNGMVEVIDGRLFVSGAEIP